MSSLDVLLKEKLSKLQHLSKAYIIIERIAMEPIAEKKIPLLYTLRISLINKAIHELDLRPWDEVVLTTRPNATSISAWGIFLGALSDLDGYIAVETENLQVAVGNHYFLAKENTIPLLKSQQDILESFTDSSWVGQILFRDAEPKTISHEPVKLQDLRLNPSQLHAYCCSVFLDIEDFFLIHGPPGTGKTNVIAHILLDYLNKGKKVLMTSYTNVAVDNALERLLEHCDPRRKKQISRIGSLLKTSKQVMEILPQIRLGKTPSFPNVLEEVNRRNIIGMTLSKLGVIRRFFPNQFHFDLTIIDEASMASTLLSLVGVADITDRFILVGDHKQLAPIVEVDNEFINQQLSVSLFEKLIQKFSKKSCLLDTQYRCSRDIMDFCSNMFYEGKVKTDESVDKRTTMILSPLNIRKNWLKDTMSNSRNLIWLDTEDISNSQWVKYGESWSAFNGDEAIIVLELWLQLLRFGLQQSDISVMSPFRLQTDILREAGKKIIARERASEKVEVTTFSSLDRKDHAFATVDANQGKEFDVVILNLTKSKIGRDSDEKERLLGDWRRLNVALTRARQKTIVVGTNAVADVRHLLYYFNLYMHTKRIDSIVRIDSSDFRSTVDRNIKTDVADAIQKSTSQTKRSRKGIGLTPEEKKELDQVRGGVRRRHYY